MINISQINLNKRQPSNGNRMEHLYNPELTVPCNLINGAEFLHDSVLGIMIKTTKLYHSIR
jgi:hypothetical protein